MRKPTERFSDRVADYVRYRPSYPPAVLDTLAEYVSPSPHVIDVGAGTGIFTGQMLERGWAVTAVEPNAEMLQACTARFEGRPGFQAVPTTAGATGLPDACGDAVVCAQAFHWFEPTAALQEFERILKPGGVVALVWNNRETDATPFLRGYEALLNQIATDYQRVNHKQFDAGRLGEIFPSILEAFEFENSQRFDLEGFLGRAFSSSYVPGAGHPDHDKMRLGLCDLFEQHQSEGQVEFIYTTQLFIGNVAMR